MMFTNNTGWAELWAWPHSLSSVAFFSKMKPKELKCRLLRFGTSLARFKNQAIAEISTDRSMRANLQLCEPSVVGTFSCANLQLCEPQLVHNWTTSFIHYKLSNIL